MKHEQILSKHLEQLMRVADSENSWDYKGNALSISTNVDGSDVKAWKEVITPEGEKKVAPIVPQDSDRRTLELWVDAGFAQPPIEGKNWTREELQNYIMDKSYDESALVNDEPYLENTTDVDDPRDNPENKFAGVNPDALKALRVMAKRLRGGDLLDSIVEDMNDE